MMENDTQRNTREPRKKCRIRTAEIRESERLRKIKKKHTETVEERQARLERERLRKSRARQKETPEQREARLERNRKYKAEALLSETPEERKARQERDRRSKAEAKLNETPKQRKARLERNRIFKAQARLNEMQLIQAGLAEILEEERTGIEHEYTAGLYEIKKQRKALAEKFEQREARLERERVRKSQARLNETPEQREARLERDRRRKSVARHSETLEQRKSRIERRQLSQVSLTEMPEQRNARLERVRMVQVRLNKILEQHESRQFSRFSQNGNMEFHGAHDPDDQHNDDSEFICSSEPYREEQILKDHEEILDDPLNFVEVTMREDIKQELPEDFPEATG